MRDSASRSAASAGSRTASSTRRCASTSSGDDVDDAVDDRDHLARRSAVEQLDDAWIGEGLRGQLGFRCARIDLELTPALAIDGDRDARALRSGKLDVVGGPGAALVHGAV